MIAFHHDHRSVPGIDVERLVLRSRNKVIERTESPVALDTQLCIRMPLVVKDLEFAAYCRSRSLVESGIHKVLDAAVSSLGDLEVHLEDEILVEMGGDYVAAVGGLSPVAGQDLQDSVFDYPTLLGEGVQLCAPPAFCGLAVPKQGPAILLFLAGQGVVARLFIGRTG